jgi:hypothetical protein
MVNGNGQPIPLARGTDPVTRPAQMVTPAHGPSGCACGAPGGICTCESIGSSPSRFIYVLGTVDIKFPDQSISEELETVSRSTPEIGAQRPNESLRRYYWRVLSFKKDSDRTLPARYVARQVCWVLKVEGQIAYYLSLRDLDDLPDLISCLKRPEPGVDLQPEDDPEDYQQGEDHKQQHQDLDLFVGSSSLNPADMCPGVTAPILAVDQLCSFKKKDILAWCKKTPSTDVLAAPAAARRRGRAAAVAGEPDAPAERLFRILAQSADNLGDRDEWRALNYLAVRYKPIYEKYADMADEYDLDSVKVATSRLWRETRIVDAVFAFRQKNTGVVQKFFVRVDVGHLFPMIINQLAEYFDR